MENLDFLSQVGITIFGVSAIILVSRKNKWGFVLLGLLSQPFWFVTPAINEQWGVFLLSAIYSVSWA